MRLRLFSSFTPNSQSSSPQRTETLAFSWSINKKAVDRFFIFSHLESERRWTPWTASDSRVDGLIHSDHRRGISLLTLDHRHVIQLASLNPHPIECNNTFKAKHHQDRNPRHQPGTTKLGGLTQILDYYLFSRKRSVGPRHDTKIEETRFTSFIYLGSIRESSRTLIVALETKFLFSVLPFTQVRRL